MTLYFSKKEIDYNILSDYKNNFPEDKINSNSLYIDNSNIIDYKMLIKTFDCALSETKDKYNAAITLPISLKYLIPSRIIRNNSELWINPKPEIKGQNSCQKEVFITEFNFNKNHKKTALCENSLIEEFINIKNALISGSKTPVDIFRKIYDIKPEMICSKKTRPLYKGL